MWQRALKKTHGWVFFYLLNNVGFYIPTQGPTLLMAVHWELSDFPEAVQFIPGYIWCLITVRISA